MRYMFSYFANGDRKCCSLVVFNCTNIIMYDMEDGTCYRYFSYAIFPDRLSNFHFNCTFFCEEVSESVSVAILRINPV